MEQYFIKQQILLDVPYYLGQIMSLIVLGICMQMENHVADGIVDLKVIHSSAGSRRIHIKWLLVTAGSESFKSKRNLHFVQMLTFPAETWIIGVSAGWI